MATVLLVEDNEVNQIVASKMIKRAGLSVDIAANGIEALVLLDTGSYELIFMDLHMPAMDGYEAANKIRQLQIYTPIIAISAATDRSVEQCCIDAGMNDFVSKPIIMAVLHEKINYWIQRQLTESA